MQCKLCCDILQLQLTTRVILVSPGWLQVFIFNLHILCVPILPKYFRYTCVEAGKEKDTGLKIIALFLAMAYNPPAVAAAKSHQSCPTVRPHRRQPTRLPRPWDSPGKNTGVGCHFLLQCMKVKSESEVAQSCPTLRVPMDCSLPGSFVHGISQARVLEWGAILCK